jgi:CheY-like chemotaxis protein
MNHLNHSPIKPFADSAIFNATLGRLVYGTRTPEISAQNGVVYLTPETSQTVPAHRVETDAHTLSRILVVDDYFAIRQGITMLLQNEPGLQVCSEAADIQQALDANRSCPHDLAIIDITLGDESGITLAQMLLREFPKLRVLMLSMHDEKDYAEASLLAGAHGYLMKENATRMLPCAIRQILNGDLYTSDAIQSLVLEHAMFPPRQLPMPHSPGI